LTTVIFTSRMAILDQMPFICGANQRFCVSRLYLLQLMEKLV
jgi:hypothetical protein